MKIKAFTSRYVNREYIVPAAFLVLSFAAWQFSGLSGSFVTNQVITRFIRDGLLVLSLIIPVVAGMGLNFAITVGAMSIQTALLVMIAYNIEGIPGILLTIVFGTAIAILTGYLIGRILNRVKGKEMITTIIIGFFANSIYQLIFLVGFGTVIPVANQDIILTRGIGVRNTVDLSMYRNTIDKLWMIQIGSIEIPLFMILVMLLFAGIIYYILHTRFGQQIKAVGSAAETSAILGIDTDKVRIKVMILSTVLAGLGQLIYLQNIGMFDVYTAHLNTDVISCAAL
jgi:simple sugar transport system permease protein